MSLLLKNAHILDATSSQSEKNGDILIEDGLISSLSGKTADEVIDLNGCFVSAGWFDLCAHFNDPGYEHKEDIHSGLNAASRGGFTDVQLIPNVDPVADTKGVVQYILGKQSQLTQLHISAAVSKELKGENLSEIYDLREAGALSFTDGDIPTWNAELMLNALQYVARIDAPIFQLPRDLTLAQHTHMHEGKVSTLLGLKGEPSISEELIVKRDLDILKYSGGRLHFSRITSANSVELIRKAKEDGLNVTADVGVNHLLFTDEFVSDFDSNFKSLPPFRSEEDRKSLLAGLKDGTIDAICSNHRPQDLESKQLEFDLAASGTISLQTFFPTLLAISNSVPLPILIDRITSGPRGILNLEPVSIKEGNLAKLTLFDPKKSWVFDDETNASKARNSPFWSRELKGKVIGIINRGKCQFFND